MAINLGHHDNMRGNIMISNVSIYDALRSKEKSLSVIGLGYVGLPIAQKFSEKGLNVIGFDIDDKKINEYMKGNDVTNEIGDAVLKNSLIEFTSDVSKIKEASFHIVAVPTPIHTNHSPDFLPLESASKMLGKVIKKGDYVIYESTVFPGLTRDMCIPILEKYSGLKCPYDFKVGYSPERINPGDRVNTIDKIVKVVSGIDDESLENIASVYELIIDAGVHKAQSMEIAEAAKIIENAQRDINIGFMNEVSKFFNRLNISTDLVLDAAKTKWNFLDFKPGLVGGHCIGVDPYYLIYKAQEINLQMPLMKMGRNINDGMDEFVSEEIIKRIVQSKKNLQTIKIGVFGVTFKEDTPDIRNSKAINIVKNLQKYGLDPFVHDPLADDKEMLNMTHIKMSELKDMQKLDVVVIAVEHSEYKLLGKDYFLNIMSDDNPLMFDIKSLFPDLRDRVEYWSL